MRRQNKVNIWGTFTNNATKFADKDCIWYSDPSTSPATVYNYSWAEGYRVACKYAQWFLSIGVKPGDCVGFYLQNSPDLVLAWMGLLAIGCYPAMINYNLIGAALAHCTKVAESTVILVDEDFQDRVLNNEELKALGMRMHVVDAAFRSQISEIKPTIPDEKYTKDANEKTKLCLRYTSGTTGFPKGVMATTGRYYSRLAAQFTQMGIRPLREDGSGDRWYICMPMVHSTAGSATLITILMPTTLCIGKKFSATRFWHEVSASRATVGTYVGEIARYLLATPPSPLDRQHQLRVM